MKAPTPPAGLGPRGRAFWRAVMVEFDPNVGERELLLETARLLDLVAVLDAEARRSPIVKGHAGQPRANPVIGSLRDARQQLGTLLAELGIIATSPASANARRAVNARWRVIEGGRDA